MTSPLFSLGVTGLLLALTAAAVPGAYADSSVTAYGGYAFGGSVTDTTTGQTLNVQDGPSYALALDFGLDPKSQVQLFFSHQQTTVQTTPVVPGGTQFGLGLSYIHFGGTYFFDAVSQGVYVVGGLGVTYMDPSLNGLTSETRFSMNFGVGYMIPIGKHLGIRFEARGYGTLLSNDGGIFCNSGKGCVIAINGQALYQGEGLIGLSARF